MLTFNTLFLPFDCFIAHICTCAVFNVHFNTNKSKKNFNVKACFRIFYFSCYLNY